MYVDVIACRRERKKVDVTLARRGAVRAVPTVVSIPVKKAVLPEVEDDIELFDIADEAQTVETDAVDIVEDEITDIVPGPANDELEVGCQQEMDPVMELLVLAGDGASDDELDETDTVEFFESESTPDEDLTAIDELLAGADKEISEDIFDDIVADALDELEDMNRRADVMRERLDGQLAEALEEINGSADEDSEMLTSIIDKELESLDSVLIQRQSEAGVAGAADKASSESDVPHAAEASAYMRYFDRDIQGDRVEVSRDVATGQEVICYDEASGRLSRVCGIIRKDGDKSQNN